MSTTVVMPKQGQSVESCIIVEWKKKVGQRVEEEDVLCEVETDKATLEVPAPIAGILLATFFEAGADVPVLTPIAVIGEAGEAVGGAMQQGLGAPAAPVEAARDIAASPAATGSEGVAAGAQHATEGGSPVSPRAGGLAERKGVDATALLGSGPGGRVIERDVVAAASLQPRMTPVAKAMIAEGGFALPSQGSGPGGRVMSRDLVQAEALSTVDPVSIPTAKQVPGPLTADEVVSIPLKGVRKIIAERMLQSLQTTAQLTMNAYADARVLQSLRKRFKESPEAMGLRGITINDLVLFAVAHALLLHRDVNAHFTGDAIRQYARVHLGFAVDTPRGLLVPVIRDADALSLRALASEAKRLSTVAIDGKSAPDDLTGGTFTVTNLGGYGVETFTPVLNPPQVGILGVGGINLRPVEVGGEVEFLPHIGLSLTINHQVVDGAPGARFLQTVAQTIANLDLTLAG